MKFYQTQQISRMWLFNTSIECRWVFSQSLHQCVFSWYLALKAVKARFKHKCHFQASQSEVLVYTHLCRRCVSWYPPEAKPKAGIMIHTDCRGEYIFYTTIMSYEIKIVSYKIKIVSFRENSRSYHRLQDQDREFSWKLTILFCISRSWSWVKLQRVV